MRRSLAVSLAVSTLLVAGCVRDSALDADVSSENLSEADEPVYVRIPQRRLTPAFVARTGFNRDHVPDDEFAFGYLPREALPSLSSAVRAEILELDARVLSRIDFDPKDPLRDAPVWSADDHTEALEGYHDYPALTAELRDLAAKYPSLTTLASAGKSVEGRELWYLTISDNAERAEDEPKLLYVANMHGDEVAGRELMVYLARTLLSGYGVDARITRLVDNAQIFIMPSMNPDGFEKHTRGNAKRVDLNRGFPDFLSNPTDTPAGRAPEVQAIMDLHSRHHFVSALNFHGGDVCFNLPWDTRPNRPAAEKFGDDPFASRAGRAYADLNPTMAANNGGSFSRGVTYGYEWYEVDGGLQDWADYYRQSIHSTVELARVKWPDASGLPKIWDENKEALLRYLETSLVGVHLDVVDTSGNPVASSTVRVSTAPRDVLYKTSRLSRPTIPGPQQVTVRAAGYAPASLTLDAAPFAGAFTTVVLTPAP